MTSPHYLQYERENGTACVVTNCALELDITFVHVIQLIFFTNSLGYWSWWTQTMGVMSHDSCYDEFQTWWLHPATKFGLHLALAHQGR
jgi:hypothetical protein